MKVYTQFLTLVLLSGLITVPSIAQDTLLVIPGSKDLSGDFIRPYQNNWKVYLENTSGERTYIRNWTDYVHIFSDGENQYFHRIQEVFNADDSLLFTWNNIVNKRTLTPLYFSSHNANGTFSSIRFTPNKITTRTSSRPNEDEEQTYPTTGALYDWNLYGMLLVGLEFKEGVTYKLPIWNSAQLYSQDLIVKVGSKTNIVSESGEEHITHPLITSDGFTFWLSKSSPYVIQIKWEMGNGQNMWWHLP